MLKPSGTLRYTVALMGGSPATTITPMLTNDEKGNRFASGVIPTNALLEVIFVPISKTPGAHAGFVQRNTETIFASNNLITAWEFSLVNTDPVANTVSVQVIVRVHHGQNRAL